MSEAISVRQGRQIVPIVPHAVRRHAGLTTRGLYVESHSNEAIEFPERELQQHTLFLYTGASVRAEIQSGSFSTKAWMRPGSLWVMPQGSRHRVRFEGRTAGVALAFDSERFASLVETAGVRNPAQIVESLALSSPKMEHLMRALAYESSEPSTSDHFGLECIATAIALAMTQEADVTGASRQAGPRLAPRQVRAVQGYVEEHLRDSVTLTDLANVAGLSAFHFLRAFKESVGVTPRQYVLDLRIARARLLLGSEDMTIAEVGLRVGFEHASHFSRAFRRAVGVAPSSFRAICQK